MSKNSGPATAEPTLPPLGARHQPLRQVVTNALRKAILSKRLPPGERLVEEQLAAELGVSRNPIREALRVLESEGLVEISPRRGASVTKMSQEEAREIVEVRAALEGLCARLAPPPLHPRDESRTGQDSGEWRRGRGRRRFCRTGQDSRPSP